MKVSTEEALMRLKEGNKKYLSALNNPGDISQKTREQTAKEGQFPYAVIVTCSDSRVIPEAIFSAGIGELFVIRSAGFVADNFELGSIEYAVEHLGVSLVLVLGHTQCGAVGTALKHENVTGKLATIIEEISHAIGDEKNYDEAVKLNVIHTCKAIERENISAKIIGAIYHIDTGQVKFL